MRKPSTSETAHDGSKIVDGDNATLVGDIGDFSVRSSDRYFSDIVGRGIDTSHYTLIIIFEKMKMRENA